MAFDARSLERLRGVYPDISRRASHIYDRLFATTGRSLRITEAYRSFWKQRKLYLIGRILPGKIVTYAGAGRSYHNYGCAIDFCFSGPDPYLETDPDGDEIWHELGQISKSFGFTWGGDFKKLVDRPHVELSYGLSLDDLQELYNTSGLKGVWAEFDRIRSVDSDYKDIDNKLA